MDRRTRLMFFVRNLNLQPGETTADIQVYGQDSSRNFYNLSVEYVDKLSFDPSINVIVVRVSDSMDDQTGDVFCWVNHAGQISNGAYIGIGYAAGPSPFPSPTPTPTPSPGPSATPTPTVTPTPSPRNDFYVSTSGSPAGDGSLSHPWDLATALAHPSSVGPGAVIWLRGGTYRGKFGAHLKGAAGLPITVRSFPGEWAVIDGYVSTSLYGSIDSIQTTVALRDANSFPRASTIIIADQFDPSNEEHLFLSERSGNNFSNVRRGLNGTTPLSHADGATVILGGNQLTVTGDYTIFRDFEIQNSDPVRSQTALNSQDAPHLRGEGIFNFGNYNKFINLVIHDTQDGFFNSPRAVSTEVYGCVLYNNGYIAGGRDNGHGLYLIHEDRLATAFIRENIVFNNSAIGVKGDSQNGDTVNIWTEGTVSFNNGSWNQTQERRFGILMGSNNGVADLITVKDCFLYNPSRGGSQLALGYGGLQNGSATVIGNWIAGGGQAVNILAWTPLVFKGNTIHSRDNLGGGNSELILYSRSAGSPVEMWNGNSYWNEVKSGKGYYFGGGSANLNFDQWRTQSGFDSQSEEEKGRPTANWVFVRPNQYQPGRANIVIYNWSGVGTVPINLSGIGLVDGQMFEIRSVQNYGGNPVVSAVYDSASPIINLSLTVSAATAVSTPVGRAMPIASTLPEFGAFVVLPAETP